MEVANICYEAVLKTSIKFSNVDFKKGSIYVAMNMTDEERTIHPLGRVLPRRKSKTGSRPWVTGLLKNAEKSWIVPDKEWSELEKKILVAEMVRIGVIVMMNTHLFRWDGRIFLQRKGGPIGLRATCCVARITMLHWDGKLLEKLKQNNVRLDEGARYMDDIRAILSGLREGWRWVEDGLYYCKEWEQEDRLLGETPTQRSSRILKGIMNSILTFLNLTMEIGDDFNDQKFPTLDLKIWIQ